MNHTKHGSKLIICFCLQNLIMACTGYKRCLPDLSSHKVKRFAISWQKYTNAAGRAWEYFFWQWGHFLINNIWLLKIIFEMKFILEKFIFWTGKLGKIMDSDHGFRPKNIFKHPLVCKYLKLYIHLLKLIKLCINLILAPDKISSL